MRGVSKTKFCKLTGEPKRSGNYSPIRMHYTRQSYNVDLRDGQLIIGKGTPATKVFPKALIELMLTDHYFKRYEEEGKYEHNGKQYRCWRLITKPFLTGYGASMFIFYMEIDTEGDFEFTFPEF